MERVTDALLSKLEKCMDKSTADALRARFEDAKKKIPKAGRARRARKNAAAMAEFQHARQTVLAAVRKGSASRAKKGVQDIQAASKKVKDLGHSLVQLGERLGNTASSTVEAMSVAFQAADLVHPALSKVA
eukprot:774490-Karenia_brevis.AAC.1